MHGSMILRITTAVAAAFGGAAAQAHDFFLIPAQFNPAASGRVGIEATVSSHFPRPENVVAADRVGRLEAIGAGAPRLAVAGPGRAALNLVLTMDRAGLHLAGVAAVPRDVDYAEDRIGLIVEEYALGPEAAFIEQLPRPRTWQVSSRRYAKTMICAARCADRTAATRPFGFDLEFVADGAGTDGFRLLGPSGQPLSGRLVQLVTADGRRRPLRTDAGGRLRLPDDARGTIMLFAARLRPPADGHRSILDLTSFTLNRRSITEE